VLFEKLEIHAVGVVVPPPPPPPELTPPELTPPVFVLPPDASADGASASEAATDATTAILRIFVIKFPPEPDLALLPTIGDRRSAFPSDLGPKTRADRLPDPCHRTVRTERLRQARVRARSRH
jgi:hypothetical protein